MWLSRREGIRAYEASLEGGNSPWNKRHLALYKAHSAAYRRVPIGENPEDDPDVIRTRNELEAHFGGPMLSSGGHGSSTYPDEARKETPR